MIKGLLAVAAVLLLGGFLFQLLVYLLHPPVWIVVMMGMFGLMATTAGCSGIMERRKKEK